MRFANRILLTVYSKRTVTRAGPQFILAVRISIFFLTVNVAQFLSQSIKVLCSVCTILQYLETTTTSLVKYLCTPRIVRFWPAMEQLSSLRDLIECICFTLLLGHVDTR